MRTLLMPSIWLWTINAWTILVLSSSSATAQTPLCQEISHPSANSGGTYARGVNSDATVVGSYETGTEDIDYAVHGFIKNSGGYSTIDYSGVYTSVNGINGAGDVVGTYYGNGAHGFRVTGDGFATIDPPGSINTEAFGINDNGDVVGTYLDGSYQSHGFLLSSDAYTTIDFPGDYTTVLAINNSGTVVGYSSSGSYKWIAGDATSLGSVSGSYASEPHGINSSGRIVGLYSTFQEPYVGTFILAPSLPPSTFECPQAMATVALGVSNAGALVGTYYDGDSLAHSFLSLPAPSSARLWVSAFIAEEWIWGPLSGQIFEGDHRLTCDGCGEARVAEHTTVLNPLLSASNTADGPFVSVGLTKAYDSETSLDPSTTPWSLTQEAKDDWIEGWPLKIAWDFSNLDNSACSVSRVGTDPTRSHLINPATE